MQDLKLLLVADNAKYLSVEVNDATVDITKCPDRYALRFSLQPQHLCYRYKEDLVQMASQLLATKKITEDAWYSMMQAINMAQSAIRGTLREPPKRQ